MGKIFLEGTHNDIDIEFSSGIVRKARVILELVNPIIHDLELPASYFEGGVLCNIAFREDEFQEAIKDTAPEMITLLSWLKRRRADSKRLFLNFHKDLDDYSLRTWKQVIDYIEEELGYVLPENEAEDELD